MAAFFLFHAHGTVDWISGSVLLVNKQVDTEGTSILICNICWKCPLQVMQLLGFL